MFLSFYSLHGGCIRASQGRVNPLASSLLFRWLCALNSITLFILIHLLSQPLTCHSGWCLDMPRLKAKLQIGSLYPSRFYDNFLAPGGSWIYEKRHLVSFYSLICFQRNLSGTDNPLCRNVFIRCIFSADLTVLWLYDIITAFRDGVS